MFESIGLGEPDGSVYAAAVAHPRSGAAELAGHCGLSATHTGRALSRLVELGMVSRLAGRPMRFLAAAPDVAVGELIGRRESELRDARGAVHRLMDSYRAASRFTHPEQSVEVLTGRDNIANRIAQLQQSAREQVRGFDKPPYLSPPGDNLGNERRRMRQGIRYRVIYDRAALAWPGRLASDILVSLREGEQGRVRPELPLKMMMADDRIAIIPISSTDHAVTAGYAIHRSSLLDALATLFEAEWDRAAQVRAAEVRSLEVRSPEVRAAEPRAGEPRAGEPRAGEPRAGEPRADPGGCPAAPAPQTHELLVLLAAGLTDQGIARSLGWSPRTTQRRIQRLLADLGATTRFQAGMNAQARGWF